MRPGRAGRRSLNCSAPPRSARSPRTRCSSSSCARRRCAISRSNARSPRCALLSEAPEEAALELAAALAMQCFINEYVFATTAEEEAEVARLAAAVEAALAAEGEPAPLTLARLAMYRPLGSLGEAPALLARAFPRAVEAILAQQVREPRAEHALGAGIPCLTPITDAVSQRVRAQYEENPYPR